MQLHQAFIGRVKANPGKTILIDRTANKRLTAMEVLVSALILAERFKKNPDGFLGVMVPNSAGSVLTVIGALLAGKCPVMINYATGADRNSEYAQEKCGFKPIVTSRALVDKLGCRVVPGMVFLEEIMGTITAEEKMAAVKIASLPLDDLLAAVHGGEPNDNAVMLFTSGSEMDPKAVPLTHGNLFANLSTFAPVLGLTIDDVVLGNLPFFHVFGQNVDLWMPLCEGMTLVTYANPIEYRTICQVIREEKVTFLAATPIFHFGYLRQSEPGDFDSVRVMVVGADKAPEALRQGMWDKHQKVLLEGYGATETSPAVSVNTLEANRPGSIGKPLPNVRVKIVDIDSGEELPAGVEGKILVKGPSVMKGYFDDVEETSRRIQKGWYETGDMGIIDADGYLWHRGRLKRFVKVGGEMVSLVKTEAVLAALLPEGIDCCVVEVPDSLKGAKIVAAVTQELDTREILHRMAEQLPAIALPREFIVIEEMPKMGSGKINFRAISDMARDRLMLRGE